MNSEQKMRINGGYNYDANCYSKDLVPLDIDTWIYRTQVRDGSGAPRRTDGEESGGGGERQERRERGRESDSSKQVSSRERETQSDVTWEGDQLRTPPALQNPSAHAHLQRASPQGDER